MVKQPLPVRPGIAPFAWGKLGESSLISRLKFSSEQKPLAEAWFGTHTEFPTQIRIGDSYLPLAEACKMYPDFGSDAHFQFMTKILSVGKPLSIQMHPDESAATILNKRHPRLYPETVGKAEMGFALSPVELFMGFRSLEEIQSLRDRIPELRPLVGSTIHTVHEFFMCLMTATSHATQEAIEATVQRLRGLETPTREEQLILRLAEQSDSCDAGIFAPLFLNYVRLNPGEAMYVPPRTIHAYLSGDVLEVMQKSDFVLRAGLTKKPTQRGAIAEFVRFDRMQPTPLQPERQLGSSFVRYSPHEAFQLFVATGSITERVGPFTRPEFLLVIEGGFLLTSRGKQMSALPGNAFLIPPGVQYDLRGAGFIARTASNLE